MITLPDQSVYLPQLAEELAALDLPDFQGVARLSRDLDTREPTAPYILVKCGEVSPETTDAVRSTVANHTPQPPGPTRLDALREKLKADTITMEEVVEFLRRERGLV